jgi:hypothetical protein
MERSRRTYPTLWFNLIRVENGKMVQEQGDAAVKNPPALVHGRAQTAWPRAS